MGSQVVMTPKKPKRKTEAKAPSKGPESTKSPDDQLADHLRIAEDHLIAAINLLSGPSAPSRMATYQSRLNRAQEGVTALYREELVRERGPLKTKG